MPGATGPSDKLRAVRPAAATLAGLLLFLFIPLVLYLFVAHPEPVGASLVAGVVLMVGHRFVARPYFERVRARKCIWCNRALDGGANLEVAAPGGPVVFAACPAHVEPAGRFFSWVDRLRLPLRLGIGLPLVALLVALGAAAVGAELGSPERLELVTDLFRLVVGLTVNLAALGALAGRPRPLPRAAFPLHNFSLLGVRNLLWVFRLVGLWWIVDAGRALAGRI